MRKLNKYKKNKGTKNQILRFNTIKKLKYDISIHYFNDSYTNKK